MTKSFIAPSDIFTLGGLSSQSLAAPYNHLLADIILNGRDTGSTLALYHKTIVYDLRPMNSEDGYNIYMPYKRGGLVTSALYGLAEAMWYREATQETPLIEEFGPIWKSMQDENGLVNSNYGYQMLTNNDIEQMLTDFGQGLDEYELFIISHDNQHSTSDLVCNNKITLKLNKNVDTGHHELSAHVIARSIDMMFGMPYDMFTAQGFMFMIKQKLEEMYKMKVELTKLSFEISNVHVYHDKGNDDPKQHLDKLQYLSDSVLYIPATSTAFDANFDMNSFENAADIRKVRSAQNRAVDCGQFVTLEEDLHLNPVKKEIETAKFNDLSKLVDFVIRNYTDMMSEKTLALVTEIEHRLSSNIFERKAAFLLEDRTMFYIVNTADDEWSLFKTPRSNPSQDMKESEAARNE